MPDRISASGDDVLTLARTIYGEARGEPYIGKCSVAWVIRNRAEFAKAYKLRTGKNHPLFGDGSISAACLAKYQFSCWLTSDPNRAKMLALTLPDSLSDPVFRDCLSAALDVIDGRADDRTQQSRHYHTNSISPTWAKGKTPVCRIGNHAFYDNIT